MHPGLPAVDLLLFFCTCNPPHIGHSEAILNALANLSSLQKVLVFPPYHHVWGKDMVSFTDRIAMARLAFEPLDPRIEVSELEAMPGLSGYSIDTILLIEKQYPGKRLGMLVGADTLSAFSKWRQWEEDLRKVMLLVAPRGDIHQSQARAAIPPELVGHVDREIFFLPDSTDTPALQTSSTTIRLELPRGISLKVSPAVLEYIQSKKLFGVL